MESKKLVATVANALDDVAWLFNLRGSDIEYNPGLYLSPPYGIPLTPYSVFFAYAVVTADSAILFVHDSQIDDAVREHLGPSVEIQSYESFFSYLKELSSGLESTSKPVSLRCFSQYTWLTVIFQTKRILISKNASLAIADAIGKVTPSSIPRRLAHDREH